MPRYCRLDQRASKSGAPFGGSTDKAGREGWHLPGSSVILTQVGDHSYCFLGSCLVHGPILGTLDYILTRDQDEWEDM